MSHELEASPLGDYAFVAARETAWHRLGDYQEDRLLTLEEAITRAHLADWNVRTVPIAATIATAEEARGEAETLSIVDKVATVRDNPWTPGQVDYLGVVGQNYQPLQNEQMSAWAKQIMGLMDGEQLVSAAGSIMNGTRTFITLDLGDFTILGTDRHAAWLSIVTAHDGSMASTAVAGATRVVCKNTADWALAGKDPKVKVRHSGDVEDKMVNAAEALGVARDWSKAYGEFAERLAGQKMTDKAFDALIAKNFVAKTEKDDTPRVANRKDRDRDTLTWLFRKSDTTETGRGTKWGALNAITEWAEWGRPGDLSTEKAGVTNLFGTPALIRAKAVKVLA